MLISAMWLLLLGAAIAGLLMLRAMTESRDLHGESESFAMDHVQSDAIETIAADIVFAGQASRWSQLPASGSLSFGGRSVDASVTSEERLLDINKADPVAITGALQDHGYDAATRTALLGRIAIARTSNQRFTSYADVAALGLGILKPGAEDCLIDVLSPFGATTRVEGSTPLRAGSVVRVTFGGNGDGRVQTLRLVAANDRPYALLDDYEPHCATGSGA